MSWRRPRTLTTRPRVSVVVPCYRYGNYLRQCVGSVLAQPGVDVDVLIVDDASPDDSVEVAQKLAAEDSRISILVHETNVGHIQTYNDGLREVDGDYVVLLSADDMLAPGALCRATALMQANPKVAFTYGYPKNFTIEPDPTSERMLGWSVWTGDQWIERACRRGRSFIMSPEVVMRGEVMRDLVGYDPRLPHSADMDLWFRAALRGGVGRVHGPPQAYYRVHENNMHLTTYFGTLHDLQARRQTFGIVFDEHATPGSRTSQLRALADRSLALHALRHARAERLEPAPDFDAITAFEAFARETWPAGAGTREWNSHDRAIARLGSAPARQVARARDQLQRRVDWRRWRYWGTV